MVSQDAPVLEDVYRRYSSCQACRDYAVMKEPLFFGQLGAEFVFVGKFTDSQMASRNAILKRYLDALGSNNVALLNVVGCLGAMQEQAVPNCRSWKMETLALFTNLRALVLMGVAPHEQFHQVPCPRLKDVELVQNSFVINNRPVVVVTVPSHHFALTQESRLWEALSFLKSVSGKLVFGEST